VKIETIAVHAGAERDPVTRSVAPPLHLSTNFELGPGSAKIGGTSTPVTATPREGPGSKTPQNLLRLSVGLESPEDLIEDLSQALGS
jgi:cystathionine beta-lyase/cystathionine gamma-synthase